MPASSHSASQARQSHGRRWRSSLRVAFTKAKQSLIVSGLFLFAAVGLWAGAQYSMPVLVAGAGGFGFLALQWAFRRNARFTDTNDGIERRVQKLEELIDQARSDIVIVTGELFHQVYDHPMTVDAFRRVQQRGVVVTIYHTAPRIDAKTVRFKALIEQAGWPISFLKTTVPHVVIVDRRHVREELESGPNSAASKLALIRYDVPKLAREFQRRIARDAAREMVG